MSDLRHCIGLEVTFRDGERLLSGQVVEVRPLLEELRRGESVIAARAGQPLPTGAELLERYPDAGVGDPFRDVLVVNVCLPGGPGDGVELPVAPEMVSRIRGPDGVWQAVPPEVE